MAPASRGSSWRQRAAGAAVGVAVGLASLGARANCARPAGYELKVAGSTVTICPINPQGRECPDADGMLRQSSTETALLPDRCVVANGTSCYVDECVPNGVYKYGFARPYECCEYCCGTDYYASVSVGGGSAEGCTPDGGAPEATPGDVPWAGSSEICTYGGHGAAAGAGGSGASGQAGAGDDTPSESSSGGCACVVGAGSRAPRLVFAANALFVLVGLALHRRRRRPPRA